MGDSHSKLVNPVFNVLYSTVASFRIYVLLTELLLNSTDLVFLWTKYIFVEHDETIIITITIDHMNLYNEKAWSDNMKIQFSQFVNLTIALIRYCWKKWLENIMD